MMQSAGDWHLGNVAGEGGRGSHLSAIQRLVFRTVEVSGSSLTGPRLNAAVCVFILVCREGRMDWISGP